MARTVKDISAEITFGEFVPPETVNQFKDTVEELAGFNDPNKAMTIVVPVADANAAIFKIQRAANDIGKTARKRVDDRSAVKEIGTDEDGDPILEGNVTLTFTLTNKHKGKRSGKAKGE